MWPIYRIDPADAGVASLMRAGYPEEGMRGRPAGLVGDTTMADSQRVHGDAPREAEGDRRPLADDDRPGDAACWARIVCPECGELGGHRAGCPVAAEAAEASPVELWPDR